MKKFLLLFLLFCVSSNFYAQELTYNPETRHFYLDEAVLSDQSFLEYAQLNCQDAALVFKKYRNEYRAGLGLMVAGGTLMATGAVFYASAITTLDNVPGIIGLSCLSAGAVSLIPGVVLYCVGKDYHERALDSFNAQKNTAELSFGGTSQGVGLKLIF